MQKRFMKVKEITEHLNVSQHTIRAWVKTGYIPFCKFGRSVRFDLLKIEGWIKAKEVKYLG